MDSWKSIQIRSFLNELPKSTFQVQHADNVGPYPFFTSGEKILKHSVFNIDDAVIFLATGGKANVKFFNGEAAYSTDTYAVNCEVEDTEYFYYFLLSKIYFIERNFFSGSGLKHLQKRDFKDWFIEIPSDVNEQRLIAKIIQTVDKAITATEQLITKYQRIKTGLLHDLLKTGIDKDGNLRSEQTHEFKDSPMGRMPIEWNPSTIEESCFVRNNLRKPLSQAVRSKMKGDYPYYGPTGILDYINEYLVEGRYVLIGEDGDHFLKHVYQEQTILVDGKFNVNNHAHILEGSAKCLTEWIYLFFSHKDITLYLTRQGAGRFKLNKAALLGLEIAVPEPDEQIEIIKII